jgi:prephenate dehydratase
MYFAVNHCLLAKSFDISAIKTIISHPQAIAQCLDYINRDFPNANIIEDVSTSAAAKRVSDSADLSIAAIASEYAAHYLVLIYCRKILMTRMIIKQGLLSWEGILLIQQL